MWKPKDVKNIDLPVEKLNQNSFYFKILFMAYAMAALIVMTVGGYTSWNVLGNIMTISTDNKGVQFLLILGVFNILNFFMLFFLWLISESSYYKMMQQFTEMWLYFKKKDEPSSFVSKILERTDMPLPYLTRMKKDTDDLSVDELLKEKKRYE